MNTRSTAAAAVDAAQTQGSLLEAGKRSREDEGRRKTKATWVLSKVLKSMAKMLPERHTHKHMTWIRAKREREGSEFQIRRRDSSFRFE